MWYMRLAESGWVPDWLIRWAIQASLRLSSARRYRAPFDRQEEERRDLLAKLAESPIAIDVEMPNEQHYEVPSAFFEAVLGARLKYSCGYWPPGVTTLDASEEAMLELTCQRARIEDGMEVLELGCGWGSLCLWIAERYPNCRLLAFSNSRTQREYVMARARRMGLDNLAVQTADMRDFGTERRFDRVLSVEMFEHMKNYPALLARIGGWLQSDGLCFVHCFSHRAFAWEFDANDPKEWMARTFFTGGTMPSDDLVLHFQRDLSLVDHWRLSGQHYARTLGAWLAKLDGDRDRVRQILADAYGESEAEGWLATWRLFFIACQETWGLNGGREYLVSHYLMGRR